MAPRRSQPYNQRRTETEQDPLDDQDDPGGVGSGRNHSFLLQTVMELQKSQGALAQTIKDLQNSVDSRMQKLDKLEDVRIELKGLSVSQDEMKSQFKETKEQVSRIHTWLIRATAILSFIVFFSGIIFRYILPFILSHFHQGSQP